ncbi:hypothetical protein AMATHDRAFT_146600 [Amanita thiersii Skay4041]|uniref:Galactose-1-phosphate uridylyltransferase n=1 Tax=Amanita thiersii Skay4041 TaxID=703135 RepID=A0A2A9NNH6_9AGAR|nr:hypothetical protein AMATHDRAFT_146600 [Amanita thiersii Skay4041]
MDASFDYTQHPHRRYNPLTKEHILVSPHRNKRPWLGHVEASQPASLQTYDPGCYLCPGNARAGGASSRQNPKYTGIYQFENDFPAVLTPRLRGSSVEGSSGAQNPLFRAEPVHGACDVLVFHPRHDLTLAMLAPEDILRIVDGWIEIYEKRGSQEGVKYVQIFENKGAIMGCSNPHPHGQVWSLSTIPSISAKELESLREYSLSNVTESVAPRGPQGRPCLLCDYAHTESQNSGDHDSDQNRIVVQNEHWLALVPWWATWPFEILVISYRRHIPSISELTEAEKHTFAEIISAVTIRYDNLFSCSFPYSMGIHQRPIPHSREQERQQEEDDTNDVAHLHVHFLPPLLRSANIRKFLVGFELMAESQRDLTPEQAAARLRECSGVHYNMRGS